MASPVLNILDAVPAALLCACSAEIVGFDDYVGSSKAFAARLKDVGVAARYLCMEGANHQDTVLALGDADSELSRDVIRMLEM
jgi:acetyl esterase/lipase